MSKEAATSPTKSAIVLGATGFVGSHIVRNLLLKGYRVEGTCRNIEAAQWLKDLVVPGSSLNLHEITLDSTGSKTAEDDKIATLVKDDCKGIFMCLGHEKQEPNTINFMEHAGLTALWAANSSNSKPCVVLTSSTGSTNPPGAAADAIKNELDFWSDADQQKAVGKWSPAAKTLMELAALRYVGRNARNEIVHEEEAKDKPRLCILNPSLILGPQLRPGPLLGNGLPWFAKIVRGKAMAEKIWNDSMSIIHVDDLAKLHIGCIENPEASGRYFGVEQSWHWEDILGAIKASEGEAFTMPPKQYTERASVTAFDTSRRDTLIGEGFQLRGLLKLVSETCEFLRGKET